MHNANLGLLHCAKQRAIYAFVMFALICLLFLLCNEAQASNSQTLGDVAKNITKSLSGLAKLITAASYVAGIGFAMMGMLKLKAHKDNPTQVPLGQPIILLVIATGLIFLPNLINTGGATVWGEQAGEHTSRANNFDFDHFG